MKHNCYHKRNIEVPVACSKNDVLSSEQVSVEGRIVTRSVYVTDDPEHRYDGVRVSDFCLENQLAAGVDLKECTMDRSTFRAISVLGRQLKEKLNSLENVESKEN